MGRALWQSCSGSPVVAALGRALGRALRKRPVEALRAIARFGPSR